MVCRKSKSPIVKKRIKIKIFLNSCLEVNVNDGQYEEQVDPPYLVLSRIRVKVPSLF